MDFQADTIHVAALNGDYKSVQKQLNQDPSLANSVDGDERTPLHWTCVSGSVEIFNLLLSVDGRTRQDAKSLESLEKADGFGDYHISINAIDQGGWVSVILILILELI